MLECRHGSDLLGFIELCPESDTGRREVSQQVCGLELDLGSSRAPFRICGGDGLGVTCCRHTAVCEEKSSGSGLYFCHLRDAEEPFLVVLPCLKRQQRGLGHG